MRSKGYLRDYIELTRRLSRGYQKFTQESTKDLLRELFKETIGIYLGFGVPKNHLGDYVQPTCMSKRFLKVGNM